MDPLCQFMPMLTWALAGGSIRLFAAARKGDADDGKGSEGDEQQRRDAHCAGMWKSLQCHEVCNSDADNYAIFNTEQ